MSRIDPIQVAQFFALPGAAELVEAFSAIPPGPVRDSVVNHAQVLAQAAGWTAPVPWVGTALAEPSRLGVPVPRLPSPYAEGLSAKSPDGKIIERLLRGEAAHVIADDLGVRLGVVLALRKRAERDGVKFPGEPTKEKKAHPLKGRPANVERMPVPAPPYWWEDPASPVWDNPSLLPHNSDVGLGTMAAMGPLDSRNYATMTRAARNQGLTLRQYMANRFEIVRRTDEGESPTQICKAMKVVQSATVYGLLAKIGRGRMETLNARPLPKAAPAEPGEDAEPAQDALKSASAAMHGDAMPEHRFKSGLAAKIAAAQMWGFPDLPAYDAARDKVRRLRMLGRRNLEIADQLGLSEPFVKGAVAYWKAHGTLFPDLMSTGRPPKVRAA